MKCIRFAVLALGLILGAGRVQAQNLLTNPNFDADLSGWATTNASQGVTSWDGGDGSPSAGSVLLSGVACCSIVVSQCVPVVAGQSYDLGASLIQGPTAPAQTGDGAGVDVRMYSDGACSVPPALVTVQVQPALTGTWTRYAKGAVVAPPGAQSALFRIFQYNFAGLPNLTSHADSAFFGPAGTVPVELQSFRVD